MAVWCCGLPLTPTCRCGGHGGHSGRANAVELAMPEENIKNEKSGFDFSKEF